MFISAVHPPLFVYGTLRDDDVIRAVIGRALIDLMAVPARLPGYAAFRADGEVYPGLAERSGFAAPGLLLTALMPDDLTRLDAFEGPGYRRTPVTVETDAGTAVAEVYMPTSALALSSDAWTLEAWQASGKTVFLAGYAGFSTASRRAP